MCKSGCYSQLVWFTMPSIVTLFCAVMIISYCLKYQLNVKNTSQLQLSLFLYQVRCLKLLLGAFSMKHIHFGLFYSIYLRYTLDIMILWLDIMIPYFFPQTRFQGIYLPYLYKLKRTNSEAAQKVLWRMWNLSLTPPDNCFHSTVIITHHISKLSKSSHF